MLFLCWSQSDKAVRSTYQIRSVDHMSCCYGNIHQLCTLYSTVFVSVYACLFAPGHEATKCVVVFAGTVVGVPGPRLRTNHMSSQWVSDELVGRSYTLHWYMFMCNLCSLLCPPPPPQVMGADGPSVVLATSTEEELAHWMAALCQAAIEEVSLLTSDYNLLLSVFCSPQSILFHGTYSISILYLSISIPY